MSKIIDEITYHVIYENKCLKLKATQQDYIHYQIGQHKDTSTFAVCIIGNDNAGLHSKEWIGFNEIHDLLSQLKGDFRSRELNRLFQSKSRNNAGFLVAILKSKEIGIVQNAIGYHFQYIKVEHYDEQVAQLQKWLSSLSKTLGEVERVASKKQGQ